MQKRYNNSGKKVQNQFRLEKINKNRIKNNNEDNRRKKERDQCIRKNGKG